MEIPSSLHTAYDRLLAASGDFDWYLTEFLKEARKFKPAWNELRRRGTLVERQMKGLGINEFVKQNQLLQSLVQNPFPGGMKGKTYADWVSQIGCNPDTGSTNIVGEGQLLRLKGCLDRLKIALKDELANTANRTSEGIVDQAELLEISSQVDATLIEAKAENADGFRNLLKRVGPPAEIKNAARELFDCLEITGCGNEHNAGSEEALDDLQLIPPLDKASGQWIDQRETAAREGGIGLGSLNSMRSQGRYKNWDGLCGIDKAGRKWRKETEESRTIWYFVPSLLKNQVSRVN